MIDVVWGGVVTAKRKLLYHPFQKWCLSCSPIYNIINIIIPTGIAARQAKTTYFDNLSINPPIDQNSSEPELGHLIGESSSGVCGFVVPQLGHFSAPVDSSR